MNTANKPSTSDKSKIDSADPARDTDDQTIIRHVTIPGESSHHVTQNQKRTIGDDGAVLSTTDDDLN